MMKNYTIKIALRITAILLLCLMAGIAQAKENVKKEDTHYSRY
jgi:hypothetical protein